MPKVSRRFKFITGLSASALLTIFSFQNCAETSFKAQESRTFASTDLSSIDGKIFQYERNQASNSSLVSQDATSSNCNIVLHATSEVTGSLLSLNNGDDFFEGCSVVINANEVEVIFFLTPTNFNRFTFPINAAWDGKLIVALSSGASLQEAKAYLNGHLMNLDAAQSGLGSYATIQRTLIFQGDRIQNLIWLESTSRIEDLNLVHQYLSRRYNTAVDLSGLGGVIDRVKTVEFNAEMLSLIQAKCLTCHHPTMNDMLGILQRKGANRFLTAFEGGVGPGNQRANMNGYSLAPDDLVLIRRWISSLE